MNACRRPAKVFLAALLFIGTMGVSYAAAHTLDTDYRQLYSNGSGSGRICTGGRAQLNHPGAGGTSMNINGYIRFRQAFDCGSPRTVASGGAQVEVTLIKNGSGFCKNIAWTTMNINTSEWGVGAPANICGSGDYAVDADQCEWGGVNQCWYFTPDDVTTSNHSF